MEDRKDLVIIGGGPAGLSAAIYAQRAMLDQVVIEKEPFCGGQIITTERIDNYLGLYGTNGYALAMKFREHADALEVPFMEGEVTGIIDDGDTKQITLASGDTILTKAIVFATGASHKMLSVKGEKEFSGVGVSYCATCDGAFFRGKTVAVVGGGDVALEDALYLSNLCEKVYLIHRREGLRGARVLQQKIKETDNIEFLPFFEVQEICGDGIVEEVVLKQNQTGENKHLEVSGLFIAIGMDPQNQAAKQIVELDPAGYIVAGEDCRTSKPGIYVAGDIRTKALRQVVTAVADGATAVASIEQDFNR
ncbi:MAG: NAD(P)/FAD-dependent oxidoreductase [Eubacterium sp.]